MPKEGTSAITLPSALRQSHSALDNSHFTLSARILGIHLHSKQATCQMHTPDLYRLDRSSVFMCLLKSCLSGLVRP